MVQLTANGAELELNKDTRIKYTMQIADIFNLSTVASSYTNSFSIPKTPNNTKTFQQLGIIGDTSTIPYEKVTAELSDNGFPIIINGWLSIRETNDAYQVSIIDGMIDFFKAIENKTLGSDLNLVNFNHEKTMETVIASFTNDYYKYIVADYGGIKLAKLNLFEPAGINIDYLVPCFSVRKLWELVMSTFGFTCDYTYLSDFIDGLYITYPKPPQENAEPELIATANKGAWNSSAVSNWNGQKYVPSQEFWSVQSGIGWDGWTNVIQTTGSYRFTVNIDAYARYFGALNRPAKINILVNGNVLASLDTDPFSEVVLSVNYSATQGDVVQARLSAEAGSQLQIRHLNSSLSIYSINLGDVSLIESFKEFSIKDFIKEIIWRTGLTPIIDNYNRAISFIPMSYRLEFSNGIDWSDKFVRRVTESYTQEGYSQKNIFKLKHNNESDTRGDGYLYVDNRNLKDEGKIVDSKIYAPETFGTRFISVGGTETVTTDTYKIWEREVDTNDDGEVTIQYKGLSNRFYFLRAEVNPENFFFVSKELVISDTADDVPFAINNETLFDELVFKNYAGYEGVLNNFRMHQMELALTELDILELDLTRPVYIEREGQYYLVNRVNYQSGTKSTAECIRINKL